MRASEAMVKCLQAEGVSVVFGYPGAAICPFYDMLYRSEKEEGEKGVRHILVRHEANGGHAASGYARITGRPGVCIATSGPGALNLIPAIATAYMDSVPLVCITGQVPTDQIGRDVFQEADVTGSAEPFVKHSYLLKNPADLPRVFKEAFYIAGSGRPGPVLIDVPQDVQETEIGDFSYPAEVSLRSYKPSQMGNALQVKRAAEAIIQAKKPLICAGGGIHLAGAAAELSELCHKLSIPVVTTMMGISTISATDPLCYGMIGMHGVAEANYAVNNCDLLILCGARVGDRAVKSPGFLVGNARIIHIDVDPAEIGKNLTVDLPIVGCIKKILSQISERVDQLKDQVASSRDCRPWLEELRQARKPRLYQPPKEGCINPKEFLNLLSRACPDDTILCADVGQNQIWACNHFRPSGGRFLVSGGMGTMGYSLPAAVGAKTASPQSEVIAVCGDGSFQMCMAELATVRQQGLAVKIIVMVNRYLGMVRELQTKSYQDRRAAVSLDGSPDFAALAASYGIKAHTLSRQEDCEDAIGALLAAREPFLLTCLVDPLETTL